jgi:hypothetical protein
VTRGQRRILGALGGLAVVAISVLWLARTGRGDERLAVEGRAQEATTTSARPPVSTETTYALVPVTTGVPIPNADQAPPPTTAPSATPAASKPTNPPVTSSPALTADGAVLARPSAAAPPRTIDKAKGCNSAADPGWNVKECGALKTSGLVLVWVVQTKGSGLRATVLREQTAGQWTVVLSASDDAGTSFSSIGVRGEDISGDGQPELAFGFHRKTADRVLAIDVVDGANVSVALHRELPRGSARVAKGELATWSGSSDTAFEPQQIRVLSGAWRVVATEPADKASVPPTML